MDYNLAAAPVVMDTDSDGFLDTAYIPHLGGNVWQFKFCQSTDACGCNTAKLVLEDFFLKVPHRHGREYSANIYRLRCFS